jgi:hypothetical protein
MGRPVRPVGVELKECLFWLCRNTALHRASENGHTETAMALVTAGADVHCTTNRSYGLSGLRPRVVVVTVRGGRSVHSGWSGRSACLALQMHGAAFGVVEGPHGDGDGAGHGRRGRALQDQRTVHGRVRFLALHPCVAWCATVSGRSVRPLGVELQECLFGCAA